VFEYQLISFRNFAEYPNGNERIVMDKQALLFVECETLNQHNEICQQLAAKLLSFKNG
jgi:hypothetical protein